MCEFFFMQIPQGELHIREQIYWIIMILLMYLNEMYI
jgi:hypothetical protein